MPPIDIPGTPDADAEPPTVVTSGDDVFVLWHEFPPGFDQNNPQPDVFLARSRDSGKTFTSRINLSNIRDAFSAQENIAVSGSRVYVVWVENGDVVFRRDRENDGQFANRVTLSNATTGTGPDRLRIVASGKNVFVAWQAEVSPGGPSAVFFTWSPDAGDSFQGPTKVSGDNDPAPDPDMTRVGDKRVLLAWRDFNGPAGLRPAEIVYVLKP